MVRLFFLSALIAAAAANPASQAKQLEVDAIADAILLSKRATPNAPNGYVPAAVDCPSPRPSVRAATQLSSQEISWLQSRRQVIQQPMRDLLNRLNIEGVDVNAVTSDVSRLPVVAIAASGGGYRALMNGAGVIAAFDNRTVGATGNGSLGGLLQASTYVAGLSGGSWLVGSLYVNNFTSVQALIDATPSNSGSLWQFQNSIFEGPETSSIQLLSSVRYYTDIYDTVQAKKDAGFNTTITDYWGRALSYQLINATRGGPGYTWSSIANDPSFSSAQIPMPIVVADGRAPGELDISSNTTVFEFNPWEMGSFDPTLYGFAPLKYVGSAFNGGSLASDQQCIAGLDSASFIMGTSSTLFNQFFLQINQQSSIPSVLRTALSDILGKVTAAEEDIADWTPNPFYNYNPLGGFTQASTRQLTLVDGGEDLQNIPLNPLIQPVRNVDVIFAVDSSADNNFGWPNATALRATYERSLSSIQNGTGFPAIPDANTFINLGLSGRPTWFGCDPKNVTSGRTPLIVYLPNSPYSAFSNVSTFDPSYELSQRNAIIQNGYNMATMGNGTVDSTWPGCAGCAIILRHYQYNNLTVPIGCQRCMQSFCWNGTLAQTPARDMNSYEPKLIIGTQANTAGSTTSANTGSSGSSGSGTKPSAAPVGMPISGAMMLIAALSAGFFAFA